MYLGDAKRYILSQAGSEAIESIFISEQGKLLSWADFDKLPEDQTVLDHPGDLMYAWAKDEVIFLVAENSNTNRIAALPRNPRIPKAKPAHGVAGR